uniref:Phospholipase A2-like central domain-containing protein n=1 Tax=Amphilophus citrinellus TaxID=61819 RepID=A0A3Q0SHR9_AMPCI
DWGRVEPRPLQPFSMVYLLHQARMFEGADRCCREHDHCLHIIPAFTVNYGVFNHNLFTVSHCECDQRCKVAKEAPYAVFRSPLPYNTSDVEQKYVDTDGDRLPSKAEQHVTQTANLLSSLKKSGYTEILFYAPADNQLLCESLKHLDYCKFKIPPFEKKYGLQNMESKTVYHCDCTSR